MFPYKVLVCGGRDFSYDLKKYVYDIIDDHVDFYPSDEYGNCLPKCHIISGEASGVDALATEYAVLNWTGYSGYPADWKQHGKKAGFLRNIQMLDESKPELVIAINGGRGTAHTVKEAKKRNIPVVIYKITIDTDTNKVYTIRIE